MQTVGFTHAELVASLPLRGAFDEVGHVTITTADGNIFHLGTDMRGAALLTLLGNAAQPVVALSAIRAEKNPQTSVEIDAAAIAFAETILKCYPDIFSDLTLRTALCLACFIIGQQATSIEHVDRVIESLKPRMEALARLKFLQSNDLGTPQ